MERNWLIRTTQYQILGPISKEKVIDFYKKGALGPDDELCSGNGYWFSIKEKDLIEKYLLGDIPQGFNPISEAPTVLAAKSRTDQTASINRKMKVESPDQTLILNASTVEGLQNNSQSHATQVINLKDLRTTAPANDLAKVPKNEDLDYPDMDSVKVPKSNDLDYPTMESSQNKTPSKSVEVQKAKEATAPKYVMQSAVDIMPENLEPVHLPKDDDLAYPDLTLTKNKKDFKIENLNPESGLVLDLKPESPVEDATKTQFVTTSPGSSKAVMTSPPVKSAKVEPVKADKKIEIPEARSIQVKHQEDRKLFVDKKKNSAKESATQEIPLKELKKPSNSLSKRNDSYFFLIIALLIIIILGVFFYYQEILNKPLPV